MRSVADRLRSEDRAAVLALSSTERIRVALALGARDLVNFRSAQNPPMDAMTAARILERRRQAGRRPSGCVEELIG